MFFREGMGCKVFRFFGWLFRVGKWRSPPPGLPVQLCSNPPPPHPPPSCPEANPDPLEAGLVRAFQAAIDAAFPGVGVAAAIAPGRDVANGEYQCNNAMPPGRRPGPGFCLAGQDPPCQLHFSGTLPEGDFSWQYSGVDTPTVSTIHSLNIDVS